MMSVPAASQAFNVSPAPVSEGRTWAMFSGAAARSRVFSSAEMRSEGGETSADIPRRETTSGE